MKKNFKFMLVALLALFGVNGAFAAITDGTTSWNEGKFTYTVLTHVEATKKGTVQIEANGTQPAQVTIPAQVTYQDGDDLYTLDVTEIKASGFADQVAIEKVTFGDNVQVIDASAFAGCTLLSEIAFTGSKLTTIGTKAFADTQITDPDFSGCTNLTALPDLLFTNGAGQENSYVKTIKMPTTVAFKTFGTALAGLTNLESANVKDTKVTIIKANAFNKTSSKINKTDATKGILALETPATVKTIEGGAFGGSLIKELTVNVDAIMDDAATALGDGTNPVYWNSTLTTPALTDVLTKLTLKGVLKGKVSPQAFAGHTKLTEVDMTGVEFASKGEITANAFANCVNAASTAGLTSVKIGDIMHNGADGGYTIAAGAFAGCTLLATVEIGDIDTKGAVGAQAFGANLVSLTIGDVSKVDAFVANSFVFKTDAATPVLDKTITIGKVSNENPNGTDYVFPAGSIVVSTAKTTTITIGDGTKAIDSKGGVFAAGAITGTVTSMVFNGAILDKGLTDGAAAPAMVKILADNTKLKTLTFKGAIGEQGMGNFSGLFYDATTDPANPVGATVNFEGELADGAIVGGSLSILNGTTNQLLTVNYTATLSDASYNPFPQDAFYTAGTAAQPLTADAERTVTLNISDATLKALITALQVSIDNAAVTGLDPDDDIPYCVILLAEDEANTVDVYQVGSTNVAYGRIALDPTKMYQVERRVKDANITYTLYTTYIEEDDYTADATGKSGVTNLNIMPMLAQNGYYYIDPVTYGCAKDLVVIVKASGSGVTSDLKLKLEELTTAPTVNSIMYTDEEVQVAKAVVTNKNLRDEPSIDPQNDGTGILRAAFENKDLFALTNPAKHNGIETQNLDYKNSTKPFINKGMYYVFAKHYDNVKAARLNIIWLDENEATAIVAAKTNTANSDVIYNMAGQKVDASYKGIVIKNGKKYVQK